MTNQTPVPNRAPRRTPSRTLRLAQLSILLAIEAIFCFTPLGSITVFPLVATLAMVPVVITGILLGPKAGTLMGFFAGLFSFCVWTFMPPNPLIAFVFTPLYSAGSVHGDFRSLLICFVPRILTGLAAGVLFRALSRPLSEHNALPYLIAGAVGSLLNTFGVLGGIFVFFGGSYAQALGKSFQALLVLVGTTVFTNGVPEAVVCAAAAYAVCRPLRRFSH